MIDLCVCTLVHPGGKVESYPEVVNDACPMHGVVAEVELLSFPQIPITRFDRSNDSEGE